MISTGDVQIFVNALRKSDTPVNTTVILTTVEGIIIKSKVCTLLVEYGDKELANFPNVKKELCKATWIDKINQDQPFTVRSFAYEAKLP